MLPPSSDTLSSTTRTITNISGNNNIRSPNNNGSPRPLMAGNRNSVCVVENVMPICNAGTKRRSWCGVPTNSRRYAEVGVWKQRNESFLEPFVQDLDDHSIPSTPVTSTEGPLPALAPLATTRLAPFTLGPLRGSAGDSLDQSRESFSSGGSGEASDEAEAEGDESEDNSDSTDTGYGAACDIGLVERFIRTHPVWFLPGIQRAGAFHLLQGKEEGNFVVRQSSQTDVMALSVRLPAEKGPYIEHYLIQSSMGRIGLETSENRFDDIPHLIAYYSQCCDELPVQLTLPRALRDAKTRQQLSSLALLGQEFWRYPMANPRPPDPKAESSEQNTECSLSSPDSGNVTFSLNPVMSTFKGATTCSTSDTNVSVKNASSTEQLRGPRPTPPNTLNLISSTALLTRSTTVNSQSIMDSSCVKTPPPPPMRWAKAIRSDDGAASPQSQNNFTLTTTVTFSVSSQTTEQEITPNPTQVEISCMRDDTTKRLSPEGQCVSTISSHGSIRRTSLIKTISSDSPTSQLLSPSSDIVSSSHIATQTSQTLSPSGSVLSPCSSILSPVQSGSGPSSILSSTPDTISPLSVTRTSGRHSKRAKAGRKISKHYQESDILDSPTVYYRSAAGDKASDYEDIWGPDHSSCSTFKPSFTRPSPFASPDLIQHTGNVISLSNNLLSPAGSQLESRHSESSPNDDNSRNGDVRTPPIISPSVNPIDQNIPGTPCGDLNKPKQASPFYAEPIDSTTQETVIRRQLKGSLILSQRHSNPTVLQSSRKGPHLSEDTETPDLLSGPISSSADNLSPRGRFCGRPAPEPKPVQIPNSKPYSKKIENSWTLDNSWQFIGNDSDENCPDDSDWTQGFPPLPLISPHAPESPGEKVTVQQVIAHKFPELNLKMPVAENSDTSCRISSYENVEGKQPPAPPSEVSEPSTIFSEPWTENSLRCSWPATQHPTTQLRSSVRLSHVSSEEPHTESKEHETDISPPNVKSLKERLEPLLSPPRVQTSSNCDSGATNAGVAIRNYALALAQDKTTTFAQNIENFISCTRESRETNPQVVMRNMRQFMSGIKNYLVKHGERGFEREVEKERSKLKSNEFLNLDAILENVLHRLVVRPLRSHLQSLFVEHYTRTGAIKLLADTIQYANTQPLSELILKPKIIPPSESDLETISKFLSRLQDADSPLEKLENLLAAIAVIFHSAKMSTSGRSSGNLGADDFLPVFVWVLVKTNFVAAEIEAEYMWGLLHPSSLSGEGGYYLTALSSAVHVLKNFKSNHDNHTPNEALSSDFPPVIKVVVPDERHGSILTKTLPVRPHMTTKQICKIIAHKSRITNPQDYALYRLVNGEETMLADNECPQEVTGSQRHGMLVYKRIDAKIAWPKQNASET